MRRVSTNGTGGKQEVGVVPVVFVVCQTVVLPSSRLVALHEVHSNPEKKSMNTLTFGIYLWLTTQERETCPAGYWSRS